MEDSSSGLVGGAWGLGGGGGHLRLVGVLVTPSELDLDHWSVSSRVSDGLFGLLDPSISSEEVFALFFLLGGLVGMILPGSPLSFTFLSSPPLATMSGSFLSSSLVIGWVSLIVFSKSVFFSSSWSLGFNVRSSSRLSSFLSSSCFSTLTVFSNSNLASSNSTPLVSSLLSLSSVSLPSLVSVAADSLPPPTTSSFTLVVAVVSLFSPVDSGGFFNTTFS